MSMGKRNSVIALTREEILSAGFKLLESEGIDAISMRALAALLNVQAASLYWHVSGKAELFGLMASAVYRMARANMTDHEKWDEWLFEFGGSLRETFRKHRDSAKLCAMAKPIGTAPASAAAIATPLVQRGLTQKRAIMFQASVISLTIGWTVFEENGPMHNFLSELLSIDESYRMSLSALIQGFSTLTQEGRDIADTDS
jgi:TetR/AcrR family tetracycline transcriptional repressor